jgi:hypothetical protein
MATKKKIYTVTVWCNGQQTTIEFPTKTKRDETFASLQRSFAITPRVQVTAN